MPPLAPSLAELLERAIKAEAQAAHWRGFVFGVVAGVLVTAFLLIGTMAVAQEIPRDAFRYQRDIMRQGRAVWGAAAPTGDFAAQIHQESYYREDARSWVGAQGLAQFMPATAKWIKEVYPTELADGDPYNPSWAIRALVRYNKHLYDRVQALDMCERLAFAMAAYNGGLGHVYNRQKISPYPLLCLGATCEIRPPGVSEANQRENSTYPKRVLLALSPVYVAAGFGPSACRQ